MATDKLKRFRVHVVKELYETEKDYTTALEFTVLVSYAWLLAKASCKLLLAIAKLNWLM